MCKNKKTESIVCIELTKLHTKIVDSIDISKDPIVRIQFYPRSSYPSYKFYIKNRLSNIALFTKHIAISKQFLLSHPINIWTALAFMRANEIFLMDDGIAYYYNPAIPSNTFTKIYLFLIRKKFKKKPLTFTDILTANNIKKYYCLMPEIAPKNINTNEIIKIKLPKRKKDTETKTTSSHILFLDTSNGVYSNNFAKSAVESILKIKKSINATLEVRPHPHSQSMISKTLNEFQSENNNYNLEKYIEQSKITHIISIYSSAIITSNLIDDKIINLCLTNDYLREQHGVLHDKLKQIGVKFIKIES